MCRMCLRVGNPQKYRVLGSKRRPTYPVGTCQASKGIKVSLEMNSHVTGTVFAIIRVSARESMPTDLTWH